MWEERNWRCGAWRTLSVVLLWGSTERLVVAGWGNGVKGFFFFLKMIACLYANRKEPKGPKGAGGSGALLLSRHENIWI